MSRIISLRLSLFILLQGTLLAPAWSQTSLDSVQHIQEIEVRAHTYKEVIPAQKLSGKTLENLNSLSVADAIRYFAGVQLKDYGGVGGLKTVDIRSMGTHHMGVFYDGIQLGNAQNGQIDLGKFSLDNIEEISLYNGQKSDIFQSAKDFGSAGTIYIRTRRPQFATDRNTNIKAQFRTGSFGLINPSVLWEQKLTNDISSSFNAELTDASGKYKFQYRRVLPDGSVAWDTTAIRQNGDIQALRLEGGLNGYTTGGKWHLKSYYYDSERGIPGAIVNNVWKRSQRQWDKNFFAQGSFQQQITDRYDLLVNAKYANDKMRYLNPDTTLLYIDNTFYQEELYASVANKLSVTRSWDINLSVDYQWNDLTSSMKNAVCPQRHTALVALASSLEWKQLKAQGSLLGTFITDKTTKESFGRVSNTTKYTPAFFVAYKPFATHNLNLRAFYKHIFRMPTFNDLYYTDIGNAALNPEYATQYNIGLLYRKEFEQKLIHTVNLSADAYYNEVTNKIIAVPKGSGQYRWMMMNLGFVKIRGLDVCGQIVCQLPHRIGLTGSLNYTYQKAQDFSYPKDNAPGRGSYKGQIAYIPWHSGSAIIHTTYREWRLNYSFIYAGERYHNSANIRANYEQPWYTHDLSIGRNLQYRQLNFRLTAEVNNLLNQQYDVILNYPMPGRNYRFSLQIKI